ncbi:DUF4198 domain-containing protein [Psychrobacter pygoscelis]|uniref:DUF4198 domain-containing protein n=1 Tax=Psychrobacter pygoscelis TaxID=2488563 RepID=UPI001040B6CA|nr:DUF4198 domain-containing protein [Psychrobacter pygoscelis]
MKKIIFMALLGMSATANAHLMFPAQSQNGYELKFWADDHWESIQNNKVIGVRGYKNGNPIKVGYDFAKGSIEVANGQRPDMLTSEYDFGYYTFTADNHYPKARNEVAGTIFDSRHIYKLGKSIYQWNKAYSRPVGMKIEVTPLTNPLALRPGDNLPLLVTMDGRPLAKAEFEDQVGDLDNVTTDAKGLAIITLRQPQDGFYIIGAGTKKPYTLTDSQAQTLQLTGVLAFKAR